MPSDVVNRLYSFLNADPKELAKKYPNVDPSQLLEQLSSAGIGAGLNVGGQGLNPITLANSGPTVPGAAPQGGQGFALQADNPFQPRNPDTLSLADYAVPMDEQGFQVGSTPGALSPSAGPNYAALLGGLAKAFKPVPQSTPQLPGLSINATRATGGPKAPYTLPAPPMPQLDVQKLLQLLKGGAYAGL